MNWLMFISSPSSALSSRISEIGVLRASAKVRCRKSTGAPNVRVSISSEPAANTLPPRASSAH